MRYTFVNGTDYRSDNISVKYQMQAIHSTKVHHYNDTLNMLVISTDPSMTTVRVSILSCRLIMLLCYMLLLLLLFSGAEFLNFSD